MSNLNKPDCKGKKVMACLDGENRIGGPSVSKVNDIYRLHFAIGTEKKIYDIRYAESDNGYEWVRKPIEFTSSTDMWDSEMMAYPTEISCGDNTWLFYNGNNFGYEGFGYAKLVK